MKNTRLCSDGKHFLEARPKQWYRPSTRPLILSIRQSIRLTRNLSFPNAAIHHARSERGTLCDATVMLANLYRCKCPHCRQSKVSAAGDWSIAVAGKSRHHTCHQAEPNRSLVVPSAVAFRRHCSSLVHTYPRRPGEEIKLAFHVCK